MGCAPCEDLADAPIRHEGLSATSEVVPYTQQLFAGWLVDDVCLRKVKVQEQMPSYGRYNSVAKHVKVEETSDPEWARFVVGHEICHAVDYQWGIDAQELLGESERKLALERFADLCGMGADTWHALGNEACGMEPDAFEAYSDVSSLVFGDSVPSSHDLVTRFTVPLAGAELESVWVAANDRLCARTNEAEACWAAASGAPAEFLDRPLVYPGDTWSMTLVGTSVKSWVSTAGRTHMILRPRGAIGPEGEPLRPLHDSGGTRLVSVEDGEVVASTCIKELAGIAADEQQAWVGEFDMSRGELRWSMIPR